MLLGTIMTHLSFSYHLLNRIGFRGVERELGSRCELGFVVMETLECRGKTEQTLFRAEIHMHG